MRQVEDDAPGTKVGARYAALLGAVTIAFSAIFVKLSHSSPSTAAIFRCVYALPPLVVLAWRERSKFGPRDFGDWAAGFGSGVFLAADLVLWHRSIENVGAGLATVLANSQVLIVPLVAWGLLGEHPGRRVLLALPVASLGVLLISGVVEHGAYGKNPGLGALYGIGSGAFYSGALLLLRRGGRDLRRVAGPLFEMTLSAAITAAVIGMVIGDARFVPKFPGTWWLILLALGPQVIGWLLITSSLPRLPAAITSLILMVQPMTSLLLGYVILGERPSALQLVGVALVAAAVLGATRKPAPELTAALAAAPVLAAESPAQRNRS